MLSYFSFISLSERLIFDLHVPVLIASPIYWVTDPLVWSQNKHIARTTILMVNCWKIKIPIIPHNIALQTELCCPYRLLLIFSSSPLVAFLLRCLMSVYSLPLWRFLVDVYKVLLISLYASRGKLDSSGHTCACISRVHTTPQFGTKSHDQLPIIPYCFAD
jgi:hypothetical protein